ncbi:hypothetical protein [Nostoc sp.]|uniref:hypothetical protein n=1 Tax=Nostoc sp. TaxID=1180 RepID=UPI002FF6DE7C
MGTRQTGFKLKQILESSNYGRAYRKLKLLYETLRQEKRTTSGLDTARKLN